MRTAASLLLLVLLALPASVAQPPLTPPLDVEAWLVGYDDGQSYPPLLAEESLLGTGVTTPMLPECDDLTTACGIRLVPAGQWTWSHVRVTRAGEPVSNATVWLSNADGPAWLRTNETGEARALLRPIPAEGAWRGFTATVHHRPSDDWWHGRFEWRGGPPLENATRERVVKADDAWVNLTLEITGTGMLRLEIPFGMDDSAAPRPSMAAIASASFDFSDGGWFRVGAATVGGKEPVLNVQSPTEPPLGIQLDVADPVTFSGGGGVGFEGEVTPGLFRLNLTLARAGLVGDDGWALRVFANDTIYRVTSTDSGPFVSAPIAFRGVAARAIIFGPHVGTYTASLDVATREPSVVLLGAATNPFTEGDITLAHDRARVRAYSEGIGGHGVGLWSMSQGDCSGRWTATARVAHGVASAYVGTAIAGGLTLPAWWGLHRAPLPCDAAEATPAPPSSL